MKTKTETAPARSIEMEIEVPGTPEQVWQAIATGPGISAWFMLTEVVEREGGPVAFHMAPGMDSSGEVTTWEPPRRFAYEERDWAPGAPPLATEFSIETRAGGTCVVRLVSSLFTSSTDWDDQLEGFKTGWDAVLRVLRLYLAHFPGQRCASLRAFGVGPGPEPLAFSAFTTALGLPRAAAGQRVEATAPGAPRLAGTLERLTDHDLTLRVDAPGPGLALLGAYSWVGQVHTSLSLFLYGDGAPAQLAREEPAWHEWMRAHFPSQG